MILSLCSHPRFFFGFNFPLLHIPFSASLGKISWLTLCACACVRVCAHTYFPLPPALSDVKWFCFALSMVCSCFLRDKKSRPRPDNDSCLPTRLPIFLIDSALLEWGNVHTEFLLKLMMSAPVKMLTQTEFWVSLWWESVLIRHDKTSRDESDNFSC